MANVKVALRVRPLSKRENAEGRRVIVDVEDKVAKIRNIKVDNKYEGLWDTREKVVAFGFDYCYWSVDPEDPKYASQESNPLLLHCTRYASYWKGSLLTCKWIPTRLE